jgi:hypothetical protein
MSPTQIEYDYQGEPKALYDGLTAAELRAEIERIEEERRLRSHRDFMDGLCWVVFWLVAMWLAAKVLTA